MRAFVVQDPGAVPVLGEFPDPDRPAEVVAAALNPVDRVITAGRMPFRTVPPPFVAGLEGVARRADGTLHYFSGPPVPYGSLAERVPLAGAETVPLPAGLDPVLAAAIGVSGLAAWLALTTTGALGAGEKVLVLGAEGQVGRLATQAARLLGAERVVGVTKDSTRTGIPTSLGADRALGADDPADLGRRLREAEPDGFDLVVDLAWGPVVGPALEAVRTGGRVVQVGNAAGAQASISAPLFRNRGIRFLPHSNFAVGTPERAAAYAALAGHLAAGRLTVEVETFPLSATPEAWDRLVAGTNVHKLIIEPQS